MMYYQIGIVETYYFSSNNASEDGKLVVKVDDIAIMSPSVKGSLLGYSFWAVVS